MRPFKETSLELGLIPEKVHALPILSSKLNLLYELQMIPQLPNNLKGHRLATRFGSQVSFITIERLLGIDAIQFLEPFKIVPCMYGPAFSTSRGLIPFGKSRCFMHEDQLKTENKRKGGANIKYAS